MRILVIDDEENARVYLSDLLEAQGFAVMSATNGREGYEAAKVSTPDLIISDIMMPEMDGFELCRSVKNDETLRSVPFVFHSATYTEAEDQRLAMKLGASRFIVKPREVDELVGCDSPSACGRFTQSDSARVSSRDSASIGPVDSGRASGDGPRRGRNPQQGDCRSARRESSYRRSPKAGRLSQDGGRLGSGLGEASRSSRSRAGLVIALMMNQGKCCRLFLRDKSGQVGCRHDAELLEDCRPQASRRSKRHR